MLRKIFTTADGSPSILIEEMGITYHSKHGAMEESKHVFINAGLIPLLNKYGTINIFEMGFGTGINAYLSLLEAEQSKQAIYYETVESNPLELNEIIVLNENIKDEKFLQLHEANWNEVAKTTDLFTIKKQVLKLELFNTAKQFHLIYFDAFAPSAQPELWTVDIFKQMFSILLSNGILVTYSSQSQARRNMQAAGFVVQKFKGIFGKRECVIARKL